MYTRRLVVTCLLAGFFLFPFSTASAQLKKDDFTFRAALSGSLPIEPSNLSDPYSFGRGLNAGLGVHLRPDYDFQASVDYTKYDLEDNPSLESTLLRPDLDISSIDSLGGGDLSRFSLGIGLKWTFSDGESFRPYIRAMGHISRVTRQSYTIDSAVVRPNTEASAVLGDRTQVATGFTIGLGFVFPVGYTSAFFIEPSYTSNYADIQTLQAIDIRAGFLLGKF